MHMPFVGFVMRWLKLQCSYLVYSLFFFQIIYTTAKRMLLALFDQSVATQPSMHILQFVDTLYSYIVMAGKEIEATFLVAD